MKCPKCGEGTQVLHSRFRAGKHSTTRRRECLVCKHRFTTIEIITPEGKRPSPATLLRGLDLDDK